MEQTKKRSFFFKILNWLFITMVLQPLDFYWCDKCQRLTRYDYQVRIQPTVDGKKLKMKIPYCTRCVALDASKRKSLIRKPKNAGKIFTSKK